MNANVDSNEDDIVVEEGEEGEKGVNEKDIDIEQGQGQIQGQEKKNWSPRTHHENFDLL